MPVAPDLPGFDRPSSDLAVRPESLPVAAFFSLPVEASSFESFLSLVAAYLALTRSLPNGAFFSPPATASALEPFLSLWAAADLVLICEASSDLESRLGSLALPAFFSPPAAASNFDLFVS